MTSKVMRRWLAWGIALVGLSVVTRPNRAHHEARLAEAFVAANPRLGAWVGGAWLGALVEYDDYGVFTRTRLLGRTVSVGAWGMVWASRGALDLPDLCRAVEMAALLGADPLVIRAATAVCGEPVR